MPTAQDDRDDVAERWTSTIVLGDGNSAVIRPITPLDAPALSEFHERQSPDSRYLRFFSPKPSLSDVELTRFTTVDFVDRVAFVVEEHGEFIAWASYERWKHRGDAEVAFMVDDHHRGKGIATLLLEHLAAAARQNGIERFTAQTLGDNRGMLAVFAKAGWPVHRRFESGVIDIDFPLADTTEFIDSVERREQRADSRAIARLLLPPSIAVIGASDAAGTVGHALWTNVSRTSRCPVYAVNPLHTSVGGRHAYESVTDVPDEIGLAVIAVPAAELAATLDACVTKRVRGAVVVTSVADDDGVDVDALVAHARRNGLRIIGPSSMGIASPLDGVTLQAALVHVDLPPGRVAVSMQSGTLASSLLRLAGQLQLGLSWFVSLGDKRDVSANDLLQFWEDDDATSVIALYTESLGNPRKFARITRRVSARKPIVAVRTGAALVGAANAALYRQTGVIEVPTVTALLDTVRVMATQPLMAGDRVAVVSNAASPAVLAAATLQAAGVRVVEAPVALDWRSSEDDMGAAVGAALDDPGVDAVMVIHAPPTESGIGRPIPFIESAVSARASAKPLVAVMLGSEDGPLGPGSDIPAFAFPEQAAAALGRLSAYSTWRNGEAIDDNDVDTDLSSTIDPAAAGSIIDRHLAAGSMPPEAIRDLLASYGVTMPITHLVSAADAVETADRIGYPVAVKALHRRVGRSVEAGIALDLTESADVVAAVASMLEHLGDDAGRVYVQRMVPPGVDLRVRITVDERIGPVLTAGLGGVQADAIGDESSRLAPISPTVARSLVTGTRAASVIDDEDLEIVAATISRVAQLASDHPQIAELDLNPVIVGGHLCQVVDASVTLRTPARGEYAVRRLE